MTIQFTTWSPDTCGCTLVYSWDDKEPGETRKHSIHAVEKSCKDHEHLLSQGKEHHYSAVLEENTRKNITHGNTVGTARPITWEWTGKAPSRILHVYHEGKKIAEVTSSAPLD